jgi:phosphoenolpyruvate synthase/pyruvate phosphate dikinase
MTHMLFFRSPKEREGEVLPLGLGAQALSTLAEDANENDDPDDQIYEKYNALLHGSNKSKSYVVIYQAYDASSNLLFALQKTYFLNGVHAQVLVHCQVCGASID